MYYAIVTPVTNHKPPSRITLTIPDERAVHDDRRRNHRVARANDVPYSTMMPSCAQDIRKSAVPDHSG